MKIGIVTGSVWATKKCDGLTGCPLLLVRSGQHSLVAADLVGAGVGDSVLLSFGSAARLEHPNAPADVAIVGIIDQLEESYDPQ